MNSFTTAVDYVNRNQSTWDIMISRCYDEWAVEIPNPKFGEDFFSYVLKLYGIKVNPTSYNHFNYNIVDPKKYTIFQLKFA